MHLKYSLHLVVFQTLLLTSFAFHQTEEWDVPLFAVYSILALTIYNLLNTYKNIFFILISIPILYIYILKFPDLANHSNLSFLIFLILTPVSLLNYKEIKTTNYETYLKTMRLITVITYFYAAFHKLNLDFFNPEVSCANVKMSEYLEMLPNSFDNLKVNLKLLLPYLGFGLEAIIPVFLFVPSMRYTGIIAQMVLHFLLAPLGFTDFSSLALFLTWSFVSPEKIDCFKLNKQIKISSTIAILLMLILGFYRYSSRANEFGFLEGIILVLIFAPFVYYQILPNLFLNSLSFPRSFTSLLIVFSYFMYGFSNYLGLRTAGTFSMFSNLATEQAESNHYLLASNSFKIFSFQDDLVEIIAVDPRLENKFRKMLVPGKLLPKIEFSRILDRIKIRKHKNLKLLVIYNNKLIKTEDAAFDKTFEFNVPAWQKKLFKFRSIIKDGPQTCSW